MRDAPSLHATRAAVEDGVVPGGSVALIRAQRALEKLEGSSEDQATGIKILVRSIEEPLRQIVANAGEHAATGVYGDMPEMGILDPTRVTRLALQNADPVTAWVTWACQVERPYRSMNETREATPGPLRLVG